MILQRLSQRGEQYVFIGNPLPFNGGWHFTAVDDFEHPQEQKQLDPDWKGRRFWHRVNYTAATAEDGSSTLKATSDGSVVVISESVKFSTIFLIGGLMPHTLNATMSDAAKQLLQRHLELDCTFAAIGHGLDVLIALGTPECSAIGGFTAAVFPNQENLLRISGITQAAEKVYTHSSPFGAKLTSASYWGRDTVDSFFAALGLSPASESSEDASRFGMVVKTEPVLSLDVSKLPGVSGCTFTGDPSMPNVAVFVDNVADPIEIYVMIAHLMRVKYSFTMISHSGEDGCTKGVRTVATETVFGNAMYNLKECLCLIPTIPANLVPAGTKFDGFFVAGGQCPYFMMKDACITAIMDAIPIAAAVCHGPEALLGSKWLHKDHLKGPFISYYGCWMSFRDVLAKYEKKPPGEVCQDESGRLFSGNAPNSTREMVERACKAILDSRL